MHLSWFADDLKTHTKIAFVGWHFCASTGDALLDV